MKENKLQIVTLPIDSVKEYDNNVKVHTDAQIEQIKKSITEFGNCDPIAVDENNVLIAGHGRVTAKRELGFTEVQATVLKHLTEDQKKAYRLVHNKLTMNTGFDMEALQRELGSIKLEDLSVEDFGFHLDEDIDLDDFFGPAREPSEKKDEEKEKPKTMICPHCGEEIEL